MTDHWYYRICGQEFGPVSLDLIRTLALSGTIAPDDEVRNANQSNWILACAAAELRDAIRSALPDGTLERRSARDEWFCRGASGDVGPLKLVDLIRLAADGELSPDEEIKATVNDYWKQVSSFDRLVELLPFAEKCRQASLSDRTSAENDWHSNSGKVNQAMSHLESSRPKPEFRLDEEPYVIRFPTALSSGFVPGLSGSLFDDLLDDPRLSMQATRSDLSCVHDDLEQMSGEAQWSGWIDGKEFGPVNYSELLTWAVTGRLSPIDFVRRGKDGQYIPAVNVPCLFTVHVAASSLSRPVTAVTSQQDVPPTYVERNSEGETTLPMNELLDLTSSSDESVLNKCSRVRSGSDAFFGFKKRGLTPSDASTIAHGHFESSYDLSEISLTTILPMKGASSTASRVMPQPASASLFRRAVTDPLSIGVSAVLTIGLLALVWIAAQ